MFLAFRRAASPPFVPPEPAVDPGGAADLWRPLHVYLPIHPVQHAGVPHGAGGCLPRGNPLDLHTGPHAEGRTGSVLSLTVTVKERLSEVY